MPRLDPLRYATLAIAVVALGVSLYAVARAPAAARETAALAKEQEHLRAEIASARAEIAALAGAGGASAQVLAGASPTSTAPPTRSEGAASVGLAPIATAVVSATARGNDERIVGYETGSLPLAVLDQGNGRLLIVNSDPKLTGKTVTITGRRANGQAVPIKVVVPPPS